MDTQVETTLCQLPVFTLSVTAEKRVAHFQARAGEQLQLLAGVDSAYLICRATNGGCRSNDLGLYQITPLLCGTKLLDHTLVQAVDRTQWT